jgi:hypothetical protein
MMPFSFQHPGTLRFFCSLSCRERLVSASATKVEVTNLSHRSHYFHFARMPNMINHQSISCEARSPSSQGHGNDYDFDWMTSRMGGETITSVAFLQESLLRTNPRSTLAVAPSYQPDQPSLMSLQGRGVLGLQLLPSWPNQNGNVPSLTDPPHSLETASSPQASLVHVLSILDDVLAILDADDSVIARMANTREIRLGDDDLLMLAFSSCSRNMPPARQ